MLGSIPECAMKSKTHLRSGEWFLAVLTVVALAAPWLAPYNPVEQFGASVGNHRPPLTVMPAIRVEDDEWVLADRVERTPEGLRAETRGQVRLYAESEVLNLDASGVSDRRVFLLGTDKFGRDVLSRLIFGARISLTIGFSSVLLAMSIGVLVGAAAALGGRWVDGLLMRWVDGLLAIPWIFLLLVLTDLFSATTWMLIAILGGTSWPAVSRMSRAELMRIKESDFVLAARGLGQSETRIFLRHMLPNVMTPLLVSATLRVGNLILAEASLSFLNVGVPIPQPSWGNMISDGRAGLLTHWWVAAFPALVLVLTVVAINVVGDRLRDVLDPRQSSPT